MQRSARRDFFPGIVGVKNAADADDGQFAARLFDANAG
jgi:hypothetical protein